MVSVIVEKEREIMILSKDLLIVDKFEKEIRIKLPYIEINRNFIDLSFQNLLVFDRGGVCKTIIFQLFGFGFSLYWESK